MENLIKSFVFAGRGIIWCLKNERNMRIHFTLCIYMYSFLLLYDFFSLSKTQFAIILLTNALVFSLELVNTAIERAVDLCTKEIKPLAKISKDTAAGAVLISAIFAVIIGIVILYQPEAFRAMFLYYKTHLYMLAVLAVSLVAAVCYIFLGSKGIKEKILKK